MSLTYTTSTPKIGPTSYVVQPGDTWESITEAAYGTDNQTVVNQLQADLNYPVLQTGNRLELPPQVSFTTFGQAAPQSYLVQSGDTWSSIAQLLYGDGSSAAAAALQTAMGNPTLTAGEPLTNLPTSLTYNATVSLPAGRSRTYVVQEFDSWYTIAANVYGVDSWVAADALWAAAGYPSLIYPGTVTLPTSFSYINTASEQAPTYYVVQPGDTWESIAQNLYRPDAAGAAGAAAALQQYYYYLPSTLTPGQYLYYPPQFLSYQEAVPTAPPAHYTVQTGDNWSSLTQTLYGTDDPNAIAALQTALNNPTLTAGEELTNLPTSLNYTTTKYASPSQLFTVQSGDNWYNIAQAVYGDSAAASVLQTALGNPTLTAGEVLTLPAVLTYPSTLTAWVQPYYTVQAGDTWASITQAIYGTSDPNAVAALQAAMGDTSLAAGEQLSRLPTDLYYTPSIPITLPSTYIVQAGDTWTTIAEDLYGTWEVADELQSALGDPTLTTGATLSNLPTSLDLMDDDASLSPYYTVQLGDTWSSITQALYGTSDPNAAAALQTALGDPTLEAGEQLTLIPATLSYTTTTTTTVPASYTVLENDSWTSITQALYGTSDPNAVTMLETILGGLQLIPGEQLTNLPVSLTYTTNVTTTVLSTYTVQAGDTWASIAQTLYGASSLASELADALGDPTLNPGEQLTDLPTDLENAPGDLVNLQPFYIVQPGDTWANVVAALYGTTDPNAASALSEDVWWIDSLTPGEVLTDLPDDLEYSTSSTVTVPPYYVVQDGDTWASIAQAFYGTSDAANALQAALGDPALVAGAVLQNLPSSLDFATTTTVTVPPYYIVQTGDTWASIAQDSLRLE